MQRAVAELEIMERDQFLDVVHREGHAHRDADGADGQQFDDAFHAHRPERPDAFHRRQADHLRLVEEKLTRTALAGIHGKLRHRLAEQFLDRLAGRVIGHVKGVDVNHLAGVAADRFCFHGNAQ